MRIRRLRNPELLHLEVYGRIVQSSGSKKGEFHNDYHMENLSDKSFDELENILNSFMWYRMKGFETRNFTFKL